MSSSLIPERPLLISPTLAETIGLEEAVMLHVLSELMLQNPVIIRKQRKWIELSTASAISAMPFWSADEIKHVQKNLMEKGLILIQAIPNSPDSLLVAINQSESETDTLAATERESTDQETRLPSSQLSSSQPSSSQPPSEQTVFSQRSGGQATTIPANWKPDDVLYQQCQQQYQIPRPFIEQRVLSIVMFQQERRNTQYSWHNTFLKWILKEWRKEESYKGAKEIESNMSSRWQPSEDAISILNHAGISTTFIEDSVPEFVLYWRERGMVTSTWNTKFIAHVRRQWAKFTAGVESDTQPRLIPQDFTPSVACYEVLTLANIDQEFARDQIQEFVIYWQDRGEVASSWNTRFLQHVKYKWATHLQSNLPSNQQLDTTLQRMTDRSWAE